ncbi:MAG TPA: hypothetical protein VFF53_10820, partial [Geobacteraceae bacterium]|nr:hypothetical protein [Geobacteraceae bacterium]
DLGAAPTVLSLPAGTKPSAIGNFIGPDFTNTITASDDNTNCVILPEGAIAVNAKGRTFSINALTGTCEVKVDNVSVGQPSAYAFTDVTADHTITATPIATGTYYTVSGDWITNVGACVTSDLNGINCASKSAKFLSGSTVVLKASTGFKVKAGTWGGDCAGSGDTCTLTNITADKFFGLTVQFEAGGTGPIFNTTKAAYYQTCGEAIAAAATNDVIKVSTAWTTGCTTAGTASIVTLSGNWSPDFSTQAGSTSMGALTITNVGVIADNLTI